MTDLLSKTIHGKLLKIQDEAVRIKKNKKNTHFKNSYFDINKMLEGLKPKLTELGLLILQPSHVTEDGIVVQSSVLFEVETGASVESGLRLPDEQNPQKMGSAVTYYRRYTLQNLLALEAEDDDGNLASVNTPVKKVKLMSGKQADEINSLLYSCVDVHRDIKDGILNEMQGFTETRAEEAIEFLKKYQPSVSG